MASPEERLEQELRTASGTSLGTSEQLEQDLTRLETQRAMLAAWSLSYFEPGGWDEVKAAIDREMALYGEPRRGERFEWEPEYPALVPAEKGIDIRETLAWGGDIYDLMSPYATERTTKHTPGVRASNILYLSEATGLDMGAAEVVYDGLVKQFFGDKQPDDIRPVTKLVHRIYTDGWLAEHGFNPPVMRVAQRFVQGDLSVDWPTVFENMPSELVPEFLQYVNLYAPEKERGIA
ncbi:MAG TPA: hypothetical protein ENN87_01045, partial [Phycisphaerales bacterium]|nr:hypothetical protein [Phycisphaerales bacterium]